MVEELLGKDIAEGIYKKGYDSAFMEKDAGVWSGVKDVISAITGGVKGGTGAVKNVVDMLFKLGILGSIVGGISGVGYNAIKEHLTSSSPKEDLDIKLKELYSSDKQELEDAKWMSRAREMRDNLKRNKNKMSIDEYTRNYTDLVNTLHERSDV